MRITKDQTVGDLPMREARDLLRRCGESFRTEDVADALYVFWSRQEAKNTGNCVRPRDLRYTAKADRAMARCRQEAVGLIEALQQKDFISFGDGFYERTEAGRSFCRALAAAPLRRENAEEVLKAFMDRVRAVNEDSRYLFRITAVVLYGSYVRGSERPADIDLAIDLERRNGDFDEHHRACWAYLKESGRQYRRIGYEFDLPEDDIKTFLKQRRRSLSLHSMCDFIGMDKHTNFSYEVLLGDSARITAALKNRSWGDWKRLALSSG